MQIDYWAHRHFEDPNLQSQVVNEDFEADLAEMEAAALAREEARDAPPAEDPEDWETVVEDRW